MSQCDHQIVSGVFTGLAARRRRYALDYLLNAEASEVSIDALVEHVVEEETASASPDREAVAATIHHRHLPKLAEEGLIEYDTEHGSIATTADTELAEPYLEFARRWHSEPDE